MTLLLRITRLCWRNMSSVYSQFHFPLESLGLELIQPHDVLFWELYVVSLWHRCGQIKVKF